MDEPLMMPTASVYALYACPQTHAPLHRDGDSLVCTGNAQRFPICTNIPHFLKYEPLENADVVARLDKLNQLALCNGWHSALQETYRDDPDFIRYVTDETRCRYLDILPLDPASIVLEVGSGLGQMTAQTAKKCKMVYGLEVVSGQARFARTRCSQSGMSNVSIACGGDDCWLPYHDSVFDIVIMNLVFEWCGSRAKYEDPCVMQRRALREIHRVLRPGGTLYLNTKNRFSLHYLTGKRDEHFQNMRFGSALPRWLGKCILWATRRKPPGGLLYSHNGLLNLLREQGFCECKSYWAAPEMRYPERFVPTDSASIRVARQDPQFRQGGTRSTQMLMSLMPARYVKHFTRGFVFTVRKPLD